MPPSRVVSNPKWPYNWSPGLIFCAIYVRRVKYDDLQAHLAGPVISKYANENACVSATIVSPNRHNEMIVTVYAISGRAMINSWGVMCAVEKMHKQVFVTGVIALVSNLKGVLSPPGSVCQQHLGVYASVKNQPYMAMPRATRDMHFAGPVCSRYAFCGAGLFVVFVFQILE